MGCSGTLATYVADFAGTVSEGAVNEETVSGGVIALLHFCTMITLANMLFEMAKISHIRFVYEGFAPFFVLSVLFVTP